MKKNLFITTGCILKRKDNTILCVKITDDEKEELNKEEACLGEDIIIPSGDKKYIPVEIIESIIALGNIRFNSRFLYFLSSLSIPMHICGTNNGYYGSYLPKTGFAGTMLLAQSVYYQNNSLKTETAAKFVLGSAQNMVSNLKYYQFRGAALSEEIETIEKFYAAISAVNDVNQLRGIEGNIKRIYYSCWKKIFIFPVSFEKRLKNPPPDIINSLISYINMITYSLCLNEIHFSGLYPEVGYLHEPGHRRLPLTYDLAEIFKPVITDKLIFKLINKAIITEKDFKINNGKCLITKPARGKIIQEIEQKLFTVITDKKRGKRLSYKTAIKEECIKLKKHFLGEEVYKPFKI